MFHRTRYGHSHIRPTCHGRAGELGRAPQSFKGRVKWEQTPTKKEIDLRIEKDENKHVSGKKRDNESGGSVKHKEQVNGRICECTLGRLLHTWLDQFYRDWLSPARADHPDSGL